MSDTTEGGWISAPMVIAFIAILLAIALFFYAYQAISQLKIISAAATTEDENIKKALAEQRTAFVNEIRRLNEKIDQLTSNQNKIVKTYKKRFENIDDRFYDIDSLIDDYSNLITDGKPSPSAAVSNQRERSAPVKNTRTRAPMKSNIRQRQNGRQRRTTFSTPSDEEGDMSDSEIAMSDARAQNKALIDL